MIIEYLVFALSSIRDLLVKSRGRVTLGADEESPCQLAASPVASEDSLRSNRKNMRLKILQITATIQ